MSGKLKNTIVVLEPAARSVHNLLSLFEKNERLKIIKCSSPEDARRAVEENAPCMFLASINSKGEVPARVKLLKQFEGAVKNLGLKIYVVTPFRSSRLADLITQKLGIPDHIVEPASLRTMHFKAALQLKAIDNFRRQRELKRLSEEKIVIKEKSPENKGPDPADNQIKIKGMPALQLEEDLFLYRNSRFESQSKRFLIELEGPDPRTGEWLPYQEKNIVGSSWRWVPAESGEQKHEQSCGSDGWVHQGEKPEFHENTGMWVLISEKPSLRFQKRDRVLAHKIRMGALNELGELFIAENSPAAEENLQGIRHKAQSARKGERKTERADLEIEQQRDPNQLSRLNALLRALNKESRKPDPEKNHGRIKKLRRAINQARKKFIGGEQVESKAKKLEDFSIDSQTPSARNLDDRSNEEKLKAASDPKLEGPSAPQSLSKRMGLPLALSDVLTNPSDPAEALNRFLGAIELSFENCLAFVTGHPDEEGFAKVEFQSSSAANVFTKIKFSEGIAEAIGGGREEGEISDYLFVKSINSRKEFNSSEKAALQQAAPGVGSLLSLIQEQRKAA